MQKVILMHPKTGQMMGCFPYGGKRDEKNIIQQIQNCRDGSNVDPDVYVYIPSDSPDYEPVMQKWSPQWTGAAA